MQRGATDKRATHLRNSKQLGRVIRLDRAAVQDADGSPACAQARHQSGADVLVDTFHLGGTRRAAGSDGPDRLVGNGTLKAVRQTGGNLATYNLRLAAQLPLRLRLTHADYRNETGEGGSLSLGVHGSVRLAMVLAALGMAQNDGGAA